MSLSVCRSKKTPLDPIDDWESFNRPPTLWSDPLEFGLAQQLSLAFFNFIHLTTLRTQFCPTPDILSSTYGMHCRTVPVLVGLA